MLPPNWFDTAADDILALYGKLDESGVAAICKRLARMGFVSSATIWQANRLQEAGLLYSEMISMIAKATGQSETMVKKLFEDAGVKAVSYDDKVYRAAGLSPLPLQLSSPMLTVLQAGLAKTNGLMRNLTLTTAVSAQQAYMQATDLAYMQVSTGVMDYQSAIAQAVKTAAEGGLSVLYPSGHVDQLDVAIRRACLTGVNQTCAQVQIAHADEMGCDLVETTAHVGARPSHAAWQGKVFSRSGLSDRYPPFSNTGYGTGAGLCGWNCRHSFFPFFEGLSESAYPREKLEDFNTRTVEYDGKKMSYYEATQKQRQMERQIRKTKRTLTGIDAARKEADSPQLKAEFHRQAVKLKKQEKTLKEFCNQTELYRRNNREQVYASRSGGFNRSVAQKAVWANKRVEKQRKYDKIKVRETIQWSNSAITKRYQDERIISKSRNERAIIYNPDGSLNFIKHGDEHSVEFSSQEVLSMRECILTHNHPHSTTFSYDDINTLRHAQLAEIRAVGRDGVFVMKQPKSWPNDFNTWKKIKKAYEQVEAQVEPIVRKRLEERKVSVLEYNQIYQMHILDILASKYQLPYTYERWI